MDITDMLLEMNLNNAKLPPDEQEVKRIKEAMAQRIMATCGGNVEGKTIAVLGLAFTLHGFQKVTGIDGVS